jgi:hypothetical protein
MDWIKTFNRGQWIIHSVFLIALLFGVSSTIFALRLMSLQNTEEERLARMKGLLSFLKTDDSFIKIGKYLSWADSEKAQVKLRDLSKKIAQTEELLEIKAAPDLAKTMALFNGLIGNNASMSSPVDALKVLNQKNTALASFAKTKSYKNIGIISSRIEDRLGQLTPKNVGGSVQVSYIKSDLKRLMQIVSSSSLDDGEKKSLLVRFTSMENEVDLLLSLNTQARNMKTVIKDATLSLGQWTIRLQPSRSQTKLLRYSSR